MLPGQNVLVLQGGGALGAYQIGVYQAMHEAGIEPDWVIGTSIGAINAAIIAGNAPDKRLERLHEFWDRVEHSGQHAAWGSFGNLFSNWFAVTRGIESFFVPRPAAWISPHTAHGVEKASYYSTAPLLKTLTELIDVDRLNANAPRLTVGAVNVRSGEMRYFDSRDTRLDLNHIMASGALPPAFAAVRIDGDPYWDGGIYSNTPIEAVLDDRPRRDSVIFTVNVWQPHGAEPNSILQVMGRQKDIQFASRADSHIARQKQIHRLRHVIRELAKKMPDKMQNSPEVKELAGWGCGTTMHVVRLLAPALADEDHTKDIDFSPAGIRARREAGYAETRRIIEAAPWTAPVDPIEGMVVHEHH
ncbi:patatin-like phospholipase family protein [Pseudolysobacter antarcticus]|uniref:Patatin-like phospholipase family protein n=2 Tax=Pseudolysobacter antarcticus TaxID=2511995 RepID=A0A411HQ98_9GAMM|nr:patatin-like phospholipase family protein [Pseudolysobacter antarcticus]